MAQADPRTLQQHRFRVLVDAHVHIHDCFDLQAFLDAAARNFAAHSGDRPGSLSHRYVLCLTETQAAEKFETIAEMADASRAESATPEHQWAFHRIDDRRCLVASHPTLGDLTIVAGRQVVTEERIEVLALGTLTKWRDGGPASEVIAEAIDEGAIPVVPWGFGKWLGGRRLVVERLIEEFRNGPMCLGDNSGRPHIMPTPPEFSRAMSVATKILPGSDPLPFASEYDRAGSFGFFVDDVVATNGVWRGLYDTLQQGEVDLRRFGSLESPLRFVRNQVAMQYLTRVKSRRAAS